MVTSSSPLDPVDPTQEDKKVLALFDSLLEEDVDEDSYSDTSLLSMSFFPLLGGAYPGDSDSDLPGDSDSELSNISEWSSEEFDDGDDDFDFWNAYGDSDDWDMYSSGEEDEESEEESDEVSGSEEMGGAGISGRAEGGGEGEEVGGRTDGVEEGERTVEGEEEEGGTDGGEEEGRGEVEEQSSRKRGRGEGSHVDSEGDAGCGIDSGSDTEIRDRLENLKRSWREAPPSTPDTDSNLSDLSQPREVKARAGNRCGRSAKRRVGNSSASDVAVEPKPVVHCEAGASNGATSQGSDRGIACSVNGEASDDTSYPKAKSKRQRLVELHSGNTDFSRYSAEDFLKPKPASFYCNSNSTAEGAPKEQ